MDLARHAKEHAFKKQGTDILSATLSHEPERNMPQKTILPPQKAQKNLWHALCIIYCRRGEQTGSCKS